MPRQLPRILRVPLLLLTLLITLLLPPRLAAANGDYFTYNGVNYTVISETDKTCKVSSKANATLTELAIPETATWIGMFVTTKYKVVEIEPRALSGCSELKSVTLPESLTSDRKSVV